MQDNNDKKKNEIEWIDDGSPIPHFRCDGRDFYMLNDHLETIIDGVHYRISSFFSGTAQMGELLDALITESVQRTAS